MHRDLVDRSLSILFVRRASLEEEPEANGGRDSGCRLPCRPSEMGRSTLDWRRRRGADYAGVPDIKGQKELWFYMDNGYQGRSVTCSCACDWIPMARTSLRHYSNLTIAKHSEICDLSNTVHWQAKMSITTSCCLNDRSETKSGLSWWREYMRRSSPGHSSSCHRRAR